MPYWTMYKLGFDFSVGSNLVLPDRGIVQFDFGEGSASSSVQSAVGPVPYVHRRCCVSQLDFLKQLLNLVGEYCKAQCAGVTNPALMRAGAMPERRPRPIPIGCLSRCQDAKVGDTCEGGVARHTTSRRDGGVRRHAAKLVQRSNRREAETLFISGSSFTVPYDLLAQTSSPAVDARRYSPLG